LIKVFANFFITKSIKEYYSNAKSKTTFFSVSFKGIHSRVLPQPTLNQNPCKVKIEKNTIKIFKNPGKKSW